MFILIILLLLIDCYSTYKNVSQHKQNIIQDIIHFIVFILATWIGLSCFLSLSIYYADDMIENLQQVDTFY